MKAIMMVNLVVGLACFVRPALAEENYWAPIRKFMVEAETPES